MRSYIDIRFPLILSVCALVILWVASFFLPGLTFGNKVLMSVIVTAAITLPSFTPYASRGAVWTMAVVSLMLGIGVLLNAWRFTYFMGGTPAEPVLVNNDMYRWWSDALYHLGSPQGIEAAHSHGFYGFALAIALFLFGQTVGAALLWSMMLILTSLIMVGLLTYKLTKQKNISILAMIAMASICYLLCMGTVILKDAFVILSMVTGAYGLTCKGKKYFFLVLLATVMIFVARRNFIFILIIGIAITSIRPRNYIIPAINIVLAMVLWSIPEFTGYESGTIHIINADPETKIRYDSEQQLAWYNMIGDYNSLSTFRKILIAPLSAVVQFFIPFPWNFTRDFDGGFTMLYAHITYPWYIFGFTAIYFFISRWRDFKTPVYYFALWGLIGWLTPCYLFGGTISRYGLPMVALLAPAVAITLYRNRRNKRFYTWFACYAVAMCCALIVAHHLQTHAAA